LTLKIKLGAAKKTTAVLHYNINIPPLF